MRTGQDTPVTPLVTQTHRTHPVSAGRREGCASLCVAEVSLGGERAGLVTGVIVSSPIRETLGSCRDCISHGVTLRKQKIFGRLAAIDNAGGMSYISSYKTISFPSLQVTYCL